MPFDAGMIPTPFSAARRTRLPAAAAFVGSERLDGRWSGGAPTKPMKAPQPSRPCRACPLPRPFGRGSFGGPSKPPRVTACGARLLSEATASVPLGGGRGGRGRGRLCRRRSRCRRSRCRCRLHRLGGAAVLAGAIASSSSSTSSPSSPATAALLQAGTGAQ